MKIQTISQKWLLEELQSLKNTNLGANEVQEQLNELNIYNLRNHMICSEFNPCPGLFQAAVLLYIQLASLQFLCIGFSSTPQVISNCSLAAARLLLPRLFRFVPFAGWFVIPYVCFFFV